MNLTQLAKGLSDNCSLNTIKLWAVNCNRDMSVKPDQVDLEIKVNCAGVPSDVNIFAFSCQFKIKGRDINKKEVISLEITYCLFYNLLNEYESTEVERDAFMRKCGVFHVWAYLREMVHSLTIKMGFSPFILPTVTIDQLNFTRDQNPS